MAGGMAVDGLDRATAETLERYGFGALPYDRLCAELRSGTASSNHVTGTVEVPLPGDITALPAMGTDARRELETAGLESMRRGEVGVVVLAGGMATRFGGVVKALAPAVDGHTFLELKVRDVAHVAGRAGATVPVYLMTSFATDERIREEAARLSSAATPIDCFAQFVSMRVTPNGELHRDVTGAASLYAPGHGDLPFALRRSHVLSRFRAAGGKYLFMSNVDN
ncbi:MAG: UTP--glucose-1-phosphate uridylyltransferase, partial [Myxococcales bacterium]|nr:UTP--glucose-1-phosphate uridylyltransferase [Myxococcales bacterium]